MSTVNYDVIIIGGGASGLAAGLYAARANLKVLLLEKVMTGGLSATTHLIENYPGFEQVDGPTLMGKFKDQAVKFGLEVREFSDVVSVDLKKPTKLVNIKTFKGEEEVSSRAVIVATGSTPRHLGLPNEEALGGKGVSYCATCDGAFFADKKVAVVGGGDSAIKEAQFLTKFASEVVIIHRRDEFRAEKVNLERARANEKIGFRLYSTVEELVENDQGFLGALKLKNTSTGEVSTEQFDGVFIYIGHIPNTEFLEDQLKLDHGHIPVNMNMETELDGVWAIGDVRVESKRQIATSVGDGVTAAIDAEEWLGKNPPEY